MSFNVTVTVVLYKSMQQFAKKIKSEQWTTKDYNAIIQLVPGPSFISHWISSMRPAVNWLK